MTEFCQPSVAQCNSFLFLYKVFTYKFSNSFIHSMIKPLIHLICSDPLYRNLDVWIFVTDTIKKYFSILHHNGYMGTCTAKLFFVYLLKGHNLCCHYFACVAHLWFLRYFWLKARSSTSKKARYHPSLCLATPIPLQCLATPLST